MTGDERDRYDLLAHLIARAAAHGGSTYQAWTREYLQLDAKYQEWLDGDAA